ncbi:hypothetical protein SAMN05421503_2074 [Terribacillus aidingensis]|uniref:Uncharacterized protein n=1 Tax=Terribacillus aidingensis TaxID=586416 RepID=A0A285NQN5_9BACI|nr:hypothetical protein SAMN05421503_2074 [Terribacillus aidingensis]
MNTYKKADYLRLFLSRLLRFIYLKYFLTRIAFDIETIAKTTIHPYRNLGLILNFSITI